MVPCAQLCERVPFFVPTPSPLLQGAPFIPSDGSIVRLKEKTPLFPFQMLSLPVPFLASVCLLLRFAVTLSALPLFCLLNNSLVLRTWKWDSYGHNLVSVFSVLNTVIYRLSTTGR